MIFFNRRRMLEEQYYKWIKENNLKDCPFTVITFMDCYGLVDEEMVTKFLEEKYESSNRN